MSREEQEPRPWLLVVVALLLVACVYARVLDGPFLWDDRALILDSPSIREGSLASLFQQPFWLGEAGQGGSVAYYRPLTSLSLWLDHALHGDNSAGFHLTNLLVHLTSVGLLFGLLRRRGADAKLACLLATLWGLLPRLTEAAAWVAGRTDALAALFVLAALLVHRPGSLRRLVVASGLGLAALACKESGVVALLALFWLEAAAPRANRPALALRLALPLLALGAYGALRASAGAFSLGDGAARGFGPRALLALEAVGRYLFMVLDPFQPRSLLGRVDQPSWGFVALGVAGVLALGAALTRLRRATRETQIWLLVGAVPLLLVLHLTALPLTVVAADRYLYLPTAALLIAAAPSLQALARRGPALGAALLALVVACGVRTFQRAGDYADEARFWVEAARTASGDATPLIELGAVAYRAGAFADALALSRRAIPLDFAERGQALDNAALMAMAAGEPSLATELATQLVKAYPRRAPVRLRRAAIALHVGDLTLARDEAEQARKLAPAWSAPASFLELLARAERPSSPEGALELDMAAQRRGAVAARLTALLKAPSADPRLALRAVDYLVAHAAPDVVRPLFDGYRERFGADGTQAAQQRLEERSERARFVHERIATLVNESP